MDRHRGEHPLVPVGGLDRELRGIEIVGDRDHPPDSHRRGPIQDGGGGRGVVRAARIEMRVGVDERRERLRGFGGGTGFAHAL